MPAAQVEEFSVLAARSETPDAVARPAHSAAGTDSYRLAILPSVHIAQETSASPVGLERLTRSLLYEGTSRAIEAAGRSEPRTFRTVSASLHLAEREKVHVEGGFLLVADER